MRWVFAVICWGLTMTAVHAGDADLEKFFKDYLEELMKHAPLEASRMGDHRYDDRLDDLTPKARAAGLQRLKDRLDRLTKTVDFNTLSADGKVDFQIFRDHLKRTIWTAENHDAFANDPRIWNEYTSDSVFLILTQTTEEKSRAIRSAAGRIEYIPKIVAAARESIKSPPKEITETAIRQNRGAISFYEKGIFEITGETPTLGPLAEPCKRAVAALKEHQEYLEKEVLARSIGNWRIGKERFAVKLDMELDAGLTADQVLKEALSEADRVRTEMYVIARQLWDRTFPGKPLPPDDAEGRRATIRRVMVKLSDDRGTVDGMVADAKRNRDELRAFIKSKDILRLPEPDRCDIIEMPEFQRGNSTAYLNPAPPLDPKAKSFYAVSPPPRHWNERQVDSYLREYNRAMMRLLSIHEAYPGHYVQLEYSNRHPSLIRRVLQSGIFAEGWAVYTEQMMLDQGFGEGDLSMRIHQLKWYLRAVVNAILDHKMHCESMTDAEALSLLTDGAFQTEGEALGKILRSKQSSCQLSTYFVGRTAFYHLRRDVSREMGDDFHLGRFHEAVLAHGTPPVKYLPELVRKRLKDPR